MKGIISNLPCTRRNNIIAPVTQKRFIAGTTNITPAKEVNITYSTAHIPNLTWPAVTPTPGENNIVTCSIAPVSGGILQKK